MKQLQRRLLSIDVFRAVTMLLMIFVNDFDGVTGVPEWIKHAPANEDALGFADIIFPAFLVIVGLSIPFAIRSRLHRRQSTSRVFIYILERSLALLVMGFFHVNLENYSSAAFLPKPVWEILITIGFFLIWLDYPEKVKRNTRYLLQAAGIVLLAIMAILYKGESATGVLVPMQPQWYGILGLIGWSYIICASIYLFSKGKLAIQFIAWALFFLFSVATHAHLLNWLQPVHRFVWIVGSGSMPAFTMAGVAVSVLYSTVAGKNRDALFWSLLIAFGVFNIIIGFGTRPLDGISKIHDTPSWVGICTGIAILVFALMIYIVDIKEQTNWYKAIRPAGTSTLTCYLIPYILYSFYELFHFHFMPFLNEGIGGFIRSFATAFIVIWIAGWLEKKSIRIKV
ncbi:DUF5009 domain-containing protein [Ilyomonas limi]|uniref:DUF5009 domain-containing protein n=1 Tax=Ilyomonas limi TaxID=2575867 RepID=A0A4U3KPR3_9BACT|nr:DUF5009 domain-containing protein [Ilyomonas limi]TKK64152.1 DUF5009 domain-containing protein [Ilyomonas limi]